MRKQFRNRARSTFIRAVPPPKDSADYSPAMERAAASILYRSPLPSKTNHAVYVLNAAALPDAQEVDFNDLLPYVLARLPGEDELVAGAEYEVVVFAGGPPEGATTTRKNKPGWGWFVQAYHVLSRAMRKRIQRLYIVHERRWVRMLVEAFSTIASPKFRRKIVHGKVFQVFSCIAFALTSFTASTLTVLARSMPIQDLLIPPSAYLFDRKLVASIHVQNATGRRAFSAKQPFQRNLQGQSRLPRVLRETTSFILLDPNVTTEGLFRIPPHVKLKEILREAYDRGQKYIVWKERDVILPIPPYEGARNALSIVSELDQSDAYGVHLASGLIKLWYQELREPIVPHSAYRELTMMYVNAAIVPTLQNLVDLFSPKSQWSVLPALSREILARHLLPLLATVAKHQATNKMTAENLAVCFAPTLVCGPNQIEDAKMSSILRRLLMVATNMWESELRAACGVDADTFRMEIQPPTSMDDYEDPLYEVEYPDEILLPPDTDQQHVGIIMEDNEELEGSPITTPSLVSDGLSESTWSAQTGPPLPPRNPISTELSSESPVTSPSTSTAPALPPRKAASVEYKAGSHSVSGCEDPGTTKLATALPSISPLVTSPTSVTGSPNTYTASIDGAIPARSRASTVGSVNSNPDVATLVKRKPVTKTSGDN